MQLQQDLETTRLQLDLKAKGANTEIDNLQSELNKSKLLKEQFERDAEKTKEGKEKLLEEHEKLKKTIETERDTITKVADKLNHCNLELEKKIKKIIPNYEVSYCTLLLYIAIYLYELVQ